MRKLRSSFEVHRTSVARLSKFEQCGKEKNLLPTTYYLLRTTDLRLLRLLLHPPLHGEVMGVLHGGLLRGAIHGEPLRG